MTDGPRGMRRTFRRMSGARSALAKAQAIPGDLPTVVLSLQRRVADIEREMIRVSPQLAALEARVEDLNERIGSGALDATPAEQAEARNLLDEVRTEHARIRARITAATVFEERLRVVEEKLEE